MTRPPASAAEPRHTRGGAGGAGRGQWVKYPLRLVVDAVAYADADTKVYGKVNALSRGRACEASVEKLAAYVGVGVSTVEKSLRRLSRPAPTDGVQELTRRQRSHKGTGTGRTNERTTRRLEEGERFVYAPVRAADTLRGTLHRLYLLARYTTLVEHRDLTLAEIAAVLRHHGGKRAGEPLHEGTVAHLLDELEGLGWITQDKRGGYRGRHRITVHDDPVHPVDEPDDVPRHDGTGPVITPDAEGGVAPDLEGGAPAYKEDQRLTDCVETELGGSCRRRRPTGSKPARSVDTAGNAPAAFRAVTLSGQAWHVLEPVRALLPRLTPFMTGRIDREIHRHLAEGVLLEDLRDRVADLWAWTMPEDIRDPGRWILGSALAVRPGPCGTPDCVRGYLRHTGWPCKACAELADGTPAGTPPGRGRGHPPPTAAAIALLECPGCAAPYRPPLRHPNCRLCHHPLPTSA
ncbi:MAG TPA: hypothetical protein VJM75_01685 [Acidimicrobiales bacterium]|nr:hypothetical protein [Acidimicrobiales bacterium]